MSLPHSPEQSKPNFSQTCCAVLTGTGRSAIGVIGLQGVHAVEIIRQCFQPNAPRPLITGQIRYGSWLGCESSATSESVVVTPIQADHFEIHCHGGRAAIARILGDLQSAGAVRVDGFAWDRSKSLLIQEAQQVLADCFTARTAAIAIDQVRGALADWVKRWTSILGPEPTALAAGLTPNQLSNAPTASADRSLDQLRDEAKQILTYAPIGLRLARPFSVVLAGPPNVGKSTLMNQIVGYNRSITNEQAGTTRDVLHADTVIDGLPIRLSDTAGLRNSNEMIEREGISRATAAAKAADLILEVSEPNSPNFRTGAADHLAWTDVEVCSPPKLMILNKSDLVPPSQTIPSDTIATSALVGDGIPQLLDAIGKKLGRNFPSPGEPVPVTERQAEIVAALATATTDHAAREALSTLLAEPTSR